VQSAAEADAAELEELRQERATAASLLAALNAGERSRMEAMRQLAVAQAEAEGWRREVDALQMRVGHQEAVIALLQASPAAGAAGAAERLGLGTHRRDQGLRLDPQAPAAVPCQRWDRGGGGSGSRSEFSWTVDNSGGAHG
jgi:hypothetical protein